MEICRKMAGYSYGRADLVRRAMAKKKTDVMLKERDVFVEGAKKNGVSEDIANDVFDEMASFASYAFNKSHAAAYAHISYQTAYLKCHYFSQYMAALMTAFSESTGKFLEYASECSRCGVKILTPDINESGIGFTPTANGIRFALTAVKNLGYNSIRDLISEREKGGAFTSLQNFCKRISGKDVNRPAVESLIKCGALDRFGYTRREMLENYDKIFGSVQAYSLSSMEGQINFFETENGEEELFTIERAEEYPLLEKLEMEKDVIGTYLSGHPLEDYEPFIMLRGMNVVSQLFDDAAPLKDGTAAAMFCTVQGVKPYTQKNGGQMAFLTVEDMTGEAEGIVFADVMASGKSSAVKGRTVYIEGKVSRKDDEPKLIISRIAPAEQYANYFKNMKLYIRCRSADKQNIQNIMNICSKYAGSTPIILYLYDMKKKLSPKNIAGVKLSADLVRELVSLVEKENIALK